MLPFSFNVNGATLTGPYGTRSDLDLARRPLLSLTTPFPFRTCGCSASGAISRLFSKFDMELLLNHLAHIVSIHFSQKPKSSILRKRKITARPKSAVAWHHIRPAKSAFCRTSRPIFATDHQRWGQWSPEFLAEWQAVGSTFC